MVELGADLPFDSLKSDFSGISGTGPLSISKILHQAVIDVNEHGTEAAAATVAFMMLGCSRSVEKPIMFRCDRPFLFVIIDKGQNGILFIGKYVKP